MIRECACGWRGDHATMPANPLGTLVCPNCGASGGLISQAEAARYRGSGLSDPWETRPGWEVVVAQPCIYHALAPREALAILEAVGGLVDQGLSPAMILVAILTLGHGTEGYDATVKGRREEHQGAQEVEDQAGAQANSGDRAV